MRIVFILISTAWLGACATDPVIVQSPENFRKVGNWNVETSIDRTTGRPISSSSLQSIAQRNFTAGHLFEDQPDLDLTVGMNRWTTMQLLCFRGEPIVNFNFVDKVGTERNIEFSYRFDNRPGGQAKLHMARQWTVASIEDQDEVRTFIDQMRTSRQLYILIRSLNAGRTSLEFQLDGAPEAIAAAYVGCPLKAPDPPPPPKKKRR
jgi:hypothetical protein